MANYQRYQTLTSATQNLFDPACPVWVSRYQISWDNQTGERLLQTRMVNVSDRTVAAVYLRILCRDAKAQALTELRLVPVTGLSVPTGAVFGDDRVVTLWPSRTAQAEIYPERVCFADGTAWNEQRRDDYLAIPAPEPVRASDPAYPDLAKNAAEGGVRNDFLFKALRGAWQCTCGLPNSNQRLRCPHCGADRTWLEQHMDREALLSPPPQPEPEPKPAPEPKPEPPAQPAFTPAPFENFDLASYLASEPAPLTSAQEEFPDIPKTAEPEPEPEPVRHTGRRIAIVLAIVLFLGAGGWFGYKYLLAPYLQYRDAVQLQTDGAYEKAIEAFQKLGDYEDSAKRILDCEAQIGLDMMRAGDYAAAYEQLKGLEGYESYLADCLYSQGVLAYNRGDYDGAWAFVERLQTEYPAYESLPQLYNCCCYGFGKQQLDLAEDDAASANERIDCYNAAKDWFSKAGEYSNSTEMVLLCDYYIAGLTGDLGVTYNEPSLISDAISMYEALDDYSNSRDLRLYWMFEYVQREDPTRNTLSEAYLDELVEAGYEGAQAYYDQVYKMTVKVEVLMQSDGNLLSSELRDHFSALPASLKLSELDRVYILYSTTGGRTGREGYPDDAIQIMLVYSLPGVSPGSIMLNSGGNREGNVRLYDLVPAKADKAGEAKLEFYDAKSGDALGAVKITLTEEEAETAKP